MSSMESFGFGTGESLSTRATAGAVATAVLTIPIRRREGRGCARASRVFVRWRFLDLRGLVVQRLLSADTADSPPGYREGFSWYSQAWPLLAEPIDGLQIGLRFHLDIAEQREPAPDVQRAFCAKSRFDDMRDGSWWGYFQTIYSSPGWTFDDTRPAHRRETALVQFSNRLLVPPDGMPLTPESSGGYLGAGPSGSRTLKGLGLDTSEGFVDGFASEWNSVPLMTQTDHDSDGRDGHGLHEGPSHHLPDRLEGPVHVHSRCPSPLRRCDRKSAVNMDGGPGRDADGLRPVGCLTRALHHREAPIVRRRKRLRAEVVRSARQRSPSWHIQEGRQHESRCARVDRAERAGQQVGHGNRWRADGTLRNRQWAHPHRRDPSRSRVVSIGGRGGGGAREEILASTEVAIDRHFDGVTRGLDSLPLVDEDRSCAMQRRSRIGPGGGPRARIAEVVDRASPSGCGGGLADRLWPVQQDGRQLGEQLVE